MTLIDAGKCPLCGGRNDCQRCTASAYKGPCWCFGADIHETLLARVPMELRNQACICRACIHIFDQRKAQISPAQK